MTYYLPGNAIRIFAVVFICFLFLGVSIESYASSLSQPEKAFVKDSIPEDTTATLVITNEDFSSDVVAGHTGDTVPLNVTDRQPYISIQELLKGNVAGVYVQQSSGEPGSLQNIYIRGLSSPLLNKHDLYNGRPTVYLNGIPLVKDNPFAFDIQKYDYNRIGPATNLLATINPGSIKSIEVIKDPATLAMLGPDAANGAIWVTTKNAHSGHRQISVNSYVGFASKPNVEPINAAYVNAFRQPFYDKYATNQEKLRYPAYLRDSTNTDYYGPSNWTDLYYRNAPLYSVDLSLTGGSDRANFRFIVNDTKSGGVADHTGLNSYSAAFFINMLPLKWLTASAMINAGKYLRDRNRSIRDRVTEIEYIPDLSNPLSPNKDVYKGYLGQLDRAIDDNTTNMARGYFKLGIDVNNLHFNSDVSFDYSEGLRNVFWPTTVLDGFNYISSYFGYSQRLVVRNALKYNLDLDEAHKFTFSAAQVLQEDVYKYDYERGYNGPNDFIKVNEHNPTSDVDLPDDQYTPYVFPDKERAILSSYYAKVDYSYHEMLHLSALVRSDGSSNAQPDHRWFMSYAFSAAWDLKKSLLRESGYPNTLDIHASYGRIGKPFNDDRFAVGPQYRVDMGWPGQPDMGSYVGIAGLSRPYTSGWVGYDVPWQYSNKLDAGLKAGLLKDRVNLDIDWYSEDVKNGLLPVPVASEYGYTSAYKSGMWINNTGVDVSVVANVLENHEGVNWTFTANANYNKSELKALPDGMDEIVIGDRKLVVGKPVDQFWLLSSEGIYNSNSEVPVNPNTNAPMNYNGVPLKEGDPKWMDLNGDHTINAGDKKLMGHFLPAFTGGFGSQFTYKGWSLDFNFNFVSGRDILDQYTSSRLDFINDAASNDIPSVKEIWFWEKRGDLSGYPKYNPWSSVDPYQSDQNIFLENGSYLKMQSVSVGFDLAKTNLFKRGDKNLFSRFLVYASATNLFTLSSFKTDNPQLVNYNGVYDGYGLPIPVNLIFGVKIDL